MCPFLWVALCLSFAATSLAETSLSLSPSTKASGSAISSPLLSSFAGFGIEPSNLFAFTGGDEPNQLSVQLLQNLASYSGAPPHIRVGGNTQDYMIYDENYDDYSWGPNQQSTAQGTIPADSMIIGPAFFKALERFPTGTPITLGLNLAYSNSDYIDKIVKMAQAAVDGMKNVKLYSFEVGNEADLYLKNQMRSGSWGGRTYTQEFLDRAEAVYNRVLKPAGMPPTFFEPPATASTIGNTFEIMQLVQAGLTEGVNGHKYVSCWNQHDYFYFIGVTGKPLTLDDLMDLDSTDIQFAYWERQIALALKTGLPYVLREMSSAGPIGIHQITDTFGAALWTLNFFLYAATLDISSVQMHMTDNSHSSAWQPNNIDGGGPFIRPPYYAHAAMAQIIGNGNGTTQIGKLKTAHVGGSYKGRIRAYSVYASGNLQSIILINSKQANASSADKGGFTFELKLGVENADRDIYFSYLTADGADSLSGTTFNGMSYSDSDGKMSFADSTAYKLRTSSSGSVSISVRDSQAVVANLGWLLGSNAVLNQGNKEWRKQSSAVPGGTGANTAVWTAAVTTTLSLAGSATGGDQPHETGPNRGVAGGQGRGVWWKMVTFCLVVVMIGFVAMG